MKRTVFFSQSELSSWASYHANLRESWVFDNAFYANLGNTQMRDFLKTLFPSRLLKAGLAYGRAGMSDFALFVHDWARRAELSTGPELANAAELARYVEALRFEENEWTFWNSLRNDAPALLAENVASSDEAVAAAAEKGIELRRDGCVWIYQKGDYSTIGRIKKHVKTDY